MNKSYAQVGDWMIVSDNDGLCYIIPANQEAAFWRWIHWQELPIAEQSNETPPPGFDAFRCNSHLSNYRFHGVVSRPIVHPRPVPQTSKMT